MAGPSPMARDRCISMMDHHEDSVFIRSREQGHTYIDRTGFIGYVLTRRRHLSAFVGPDGCGKSMALSALDAYLNIKYKGESDRWFEGLEIDGNTDYVIHRNAYPVITMDFGSIPGHSLEEASEGLRRQVMKIYGSHPELLDSPSIGEYDRIRMDPIISGGFDKTDLMYSGRLLCNLLYGHHCSWPVVLIDGYDKPVMDSFDTPDHEDVFRLLSGFLRAMIKDNGDLFMCILMGTHGSYDEVAPGYRGNPMIDSISSPRVGRWFGPVGTTVSDDVRSGFDPSKLIRNSI